MNPKGILRSKTLYGIATMLFSTFVPNLVSHGVAWLATKLGLTLTPDQAANEVSNVMLWGGGALAAWGRIVAQGPLTVTAPAAKAAPVILLCILPFLGGCASLQTNIDNGITTFTKDVNTVAKDAVTAGQATVAIGGDAVIVGTDVVKSAGAVVLATNPPPAAAPAATSK